MASSYGSIFSFAKSQAQQKTAEPDDNYGMPSNWVPIDSAPVDPNRPPAYQTPAAGIDPYGSGPLPQNFGYEPALVKTGYGGTAGPIPLMPIQGAGVPQTNAGIQQTAKKIATNVVNEAIAGISSVTLTGGNGITIAGTVVELTNPLVDGNPIWQIDPGIEVLRDDFRWQGPSTASTTGYGETGFVVGAINGGSVFSNASFPGNIFHPGYVNVGLSQTTANLGAVFYRQQFQTAPGQIQSWNRVKPVLDYAGWTMTWVFNFDVAFSSGSDFYNVGFSLAHTSFYIGMCNQNGGSTGNSVFNCRPSVFMGLRYDTDPGDSYAITSVANASGGTTVYTGTFANGGSNILAGNLITITGCVASNNNGAFYCTASSTTTITVTNAAGTSAVGQTATGRIAAISDSTMKFEYVANPTASATQRNNTQGQVFDTGVVPTQGVWYRLDMSSTTAGTVTFVLSGNGSQLATWTMTATTVQLGVGTNTNQAFYSGGPYALIDFAVTETFNGVDFEWTPFGIGSQVTFSGTSVPSQVTGKFPLYASSAQNFLFIIPIASFVTASCKPIGVGFPAMEPFWSFSNDSAGGPATSYERAVNIDFFGWAWNPALAGSSVNSGYSRYFPGT